GTLLPGFQTLAIQRTTADRSGHAISTFFIFYDLGIALGAVVWGAIIGGFGFKTMYFVCAVLILVTVALLYIQLTIHQRKVSKNLFIIICFYIKYLYLL